MLQWSLVFVWRLRCGVAEVCGVAGVWGVAGVRGVAGVCGVRSGVCAHLSHRHIGARDGQCAAEQQRPPPHSVNEQHAAADT